MSEISPEDSIAKNLNFLQESRSDLSEDKTFVIPSRSIKNDDLISDITSNNFSRKRGKKKGEDEENGGGSVMSQPEKIKKERLESVKESSEASSRSRFKIRKRPSRVYQTSDYNGGSGRGRRTPELNMRGDFDLMMKQTGRSSNSRSRNGGHEIRRKPKVNSIRTSKTKPLLLPDFLDRSKIEIVKRSGTGKTKLTSSTKVGDLSRKTTNSKKISEAVEMNPKCFKPSNPLKPVSKLTQPTIPKFALQLIKKLRPDKFSASSKNNNSSLISGSYRTTQNHSKHAVNGAEKDFGSSGSTKLHEEDEGPR